MIYKLLISESAHKDISAISNFIADRNSLEVANKVANKIYATIDDILKYPKLGISLRNRFDVDSDQLFSVVTPYPYLVFYKIIGSEIFVSSIIDGRQDYLSILSKV